MNRYETRLGVNGAGRIRSSSSATFGDAIGKAMRWRKSNGIGSYWSMVYDHADNGRLIWLNGECV